MKQRNDLRTAFKAVFLKRRCLVSKQNTFQSYKSREIWSFAITFGQQLVWHKFIYKQEKRSWEFSSFYSQAKKSWAKYYTKCIAFVGGRTNWRPRSAYSSTGSSSRLPFCHSCLTNWDTSQAKYSVGLRQPQMKRSADYSHDQGLGKPIITTVGYLEKQF